MLRLGSTRLDSLDGWCVKFHSMQMSRVLIEAGFKWIVSRDKSESPGLHWVKIEAFILMIDAHS